MVVVGDGAVGVCVLVVEVIVVNDAVDVATMLDVVVVGFWVIVVAEMYESFTCNNKILLNSSI